MSTVSSRSPSFHWPRALLGMLALMAGVEFVAVKKHDRITTLNIEAWRRPGQSVPKTRECGLLAFGDSLVKYGVFPKVIERRLGLRAYNLAMPGGRAAGSYFLLRRALDAGARPKAVFVDGEALRNDPMVMVYLWPHLATLPECAELAWTARDATAFAQMLLEKALPTYGSRLEIRRWVMHTIKRGNVVDYEPNHLPLFRRNWDRNLGAEGKPRFQDESGTDIRPARLAGENYAPTSWTPDPVNTEYSERFVELAAEHGIAVYWLLPPLHPAVEARRQRLGWYENYLPYLRSLTVRYPNVTVVDARCSNYGPELLGDMTHLDADGAVVFTTAMADLVGERLASGPGSQWVNLPRVCPGAVAALAQAFDDDVEDIGETAAAFSRWQARLAVGGVSSDAKRRP
jgi:hypothetical protein